MSPIAALIGGLFAAHAAHGADVLLAQAPSAPASAAAPAPAPAPAAQAAAPAGGGQLESVVVTARRRVETLFDVPASVTAVSGETLRAKGVTRAQDIVAMSPNAVIPDDPQGFNTYINIRGIRQADPQAEPNFGLYRNGIYNGGHRTNLGAMIDIDRVELLRGPQGGLYGRNAVGGAMDIIYKMPRPGDTLSGYATLSAERYDRTRVEGAVTMPVNDNTALRFTGWSVDQKKGEYYNITRGEEIDRQRDQGLRASAAVNFTPALSAVWSAEYQKTRGPSLRAYAPDGVTNGFAKSAPETPDTIQQSSPSIANTEQFYLTQKLTYAVDAGTLTLLAAYRDYKLDSIEDADGTALPLNTAPVVLMQEAQRAEKVKNYYVEALWASPEDQPLTYRAGVSFFKEDFDFARIYTTEMDLSQIGVANLILHGSGGLPKAGSKIGTKSVSLFGDLRYAITPQLAATASLRWTQDKESLNYEQGILPSGDALQDGLAVAIFGTQVPTYALQTERTFKFTSPAAGLEYKLSPDINVYALFSTGYRPGGFNTTSTNPDLLPYDKESARNYEAGIKTKWLDGQVGVNLSVFRMDQKNLVLAQDDPVPNQFSFTYLANVGKARTYGAELESMARVNSWLGAAFSVGYLDAKFTEGTANAGTVNAFDMTDKEVPYTRPWTVNARVDVARPVTSTVQFFGSLGVRREIGGKIGGRSEEDYANLTKLDLNAGLRFNKQWQLNAFVLNATDKKIVQFRFNNGDVTTNRGRTFGLQGTYTF